MAVVVPPPPPHRGRGSAAAAVADVFPPRPPAQDVDVAFPPRPPPVPVPAGASAAAFPPLPPPPAGLVAGTSRLRLVVPATVADLAIGLFGLSAKEASDPQRQAASAAFAANGATSDGRRPAEISVSGIGREDIERALCGLLRKAEATIASAAAGRKRISVAVVAPRSLAEALLADGGARLRALCRGSPVSLRLAVEPGSSADERLLVATAPPEGILVAVVDLFEQLSTLEQAPPPATQPRQQPGPGAEPDLRRKRPRREASPPLAAPASAGGASAAAAAAPEPAPALEPRGNVVLWRWLKGLDGGRGDMLRYCDKMNEFFDDISELEMVMRGPNGEVPDPVLFVDLEVESAADQEIFRRWFVSRS
eukprot:TRINITY_DN255_c0_g8_i1.p1 TRINITY_DN255_c0_g8~~TRINITY_DN255_c0_g8_i1.p1  ORF type:complete len:397 (-),score=81.41 TRINITY_DN255_c0_g8_i1:48-1145(-)